MWRNSDVNKRNMLWGGAVMKQEGQLDVNKRNDDNEGAADETRWSKHLAT
jgi:hypothetical protein